jgi:hypothetical protein
MSKRIHKSLIESQLFRRRSVRLSNGQAGKQYQRYESNTAALTRPTVAIHSSVSFQYTAVARLHVAPVILVLALTIPEGHPREFSIPPGRS